MGPFDHYTDFGGSFLKFLHVSLISPRLALKPIAILFPRFAAITHPGRAQVAPLGRSHYASELRRLLSVKVLLLLVILFPAQLPFWGTRTHRLTLHTWIHSLRKNPYINPHFDHPKGALTSPDAPFSGTTWPPDSGTPGFTPSRRPEPEIFPPLLISSLTFQDQKRKTLTVVVVVVLRKRAQFTTTHT